MVMRTTRLVRVGIEYLHDFRIEPRRELVVHVDFLHQLHMPSLSAAQCPGYTYTLFSINARTRCEHPSPMPSWKNAIWSEATLQICPRWCDGQSTTYVEHVVKASVWEVTSESHTHLPRYLTNFSSFEPKSSQRCEWPRDRPHEYSAGLRFRFLNNWAYGLSCRALQRDCQWWWGLED
jgi:hypothetical protein